MEQTVNNLTSNQVANGANPHKQNPNHQPANKNIIKILIASVLVVAVLGLVYYGFFVANKIAVEKAAISASSIDLASQIGGTLEEVMVKPGDSVQVDQVVARVGNELIKTTLAGEVIAVKDNFGKSIAKGESVVTMIDRGDLRVEGRLAEDKGLKDVKLGQKVVFTVDAYGGKKYFGIVDEISPTSKESDLAFSISDKREKKDFIIKVRFNYEAYPELKNGMSAKIWIYKN